MDSQKNSIEKIFHTFASQQQKEQSKQFQNFMNLKTSFVINFFYERAKYLKNSQILISLRLLFIATMSKLDEKFIKDIEK